MSELTYIELMRSHVFFAGTQCFRQVERGPDRFALFPPEKLSVVALHQFPRLAFAETGGRLVWGAGLGLPECAKSMPEQGTESNIAVFR